MHEIKVDYHTYMGIRTGVASALIVDESEKYLAHSEIIITCSEHPDTEYPMDSVVCSINTIRSGKDVSGLKKDFALAFVSVVRTVPSSEVLQLLN